MILTQPEIIQILRRRMDMNQGTLGARAFDTSFESGRTKIKNIELGRQKPTSADLGKIATVLKVPVAALIPSKTDPETLESPSSKASEMLCLTPSAQALFPGLPPYFEMLNKAVTIADEELIQHLSDKIAQLFQQQSRTTTAKTGLLVSGKK